jgi:hypothetical protein
VLTFGANGPRAQVNQVNIDCIGKRIITAILLTSCGLVSLSCNVASGNEEFFGKTTPPERNILRYVNGPEPESFDPAISSGQTEARIYMALFEGLVEYHPKSLDAIPTPLSLFSICATMRAGLTAIPSTPTISLTACAGLCPRRSNPARRILPTTSSTLRLLTPSQSLCVINKRGRSSWSKTSPTGQSSLHCP